VAVLITHHMALADIINLVLAFGIALPDGDFDEPGFWQIDGVWYKCPLWIEELL
jgi:hypothetical protein